MAPIQECSTRSNNFPAARDAENVLALHCEIFLGPQGPLPLTGVTHRTLSSLDADLLQCLQPKLVIMPLFTADHDATTAIERLAALGYTGPVTVIAPKLPNPRLVERELASLGLAVTLISP
jgi:hypothetical protein